MRYNQSELICKSLTPHFATILFKNSSIHIKISCGLRTQLTTMIASVVQVKPFKPSKYDLSSCVDVKNKNHDSASALHNISV